MIGTGGEVTATCVDVLAIGGGFVRRSQAFVASGSGNVERGLGMLRTH